MSVFARILLFTVVVSLAGCSSAEQAQAPGGGGMMQMPPVPASTSPAVEENVPVQVHAFGTVEAFASVDVKSQVAGPLLSVKFTEGTNVAKGDLLFEVDPRPFQEVLRQAEATLTKDNAQLQLAEANLARDQANQKNVDVDAARYAQLAQEGIATRMQTEQLRTSADMAREAVRAGQAAIASIRASLDSDRAVIEKAKLDLSYCQIHAPISGRTGNLLVHAGNLLKVNDNALVVINQIAPIFVSFGVPERDFNAVASKSRGKKVAVHASFDDGTGLAEGSLSVIDNKIDPSTGTNRLKAVFRAEVINTNTVKFYEDKERAKELRNPNSRFVAEALYDQICSLEGLKSEYRGKFQVNLKKKKRS